ncbi:hypothetical protein OHAE_3389 [Ochrobactrum soli]|uniref:Uncharacterized protein n=1 Tax=Ochrobactrum soli TaxID=2448455 RepID=A0A2P9HH65_9HYPH|nr:hypothetical protein OHAE_3389 [[Ochrobactrum] soli]
MKIVTRCHENYDEMGLFVQSTVIEIMTSLFYHTHTQRSVGHVVI